MDPDIQEFPVARPVLSGCVKAPDPLQRKVKQVNAAK